MNTRQFQMMDELTLHSRLEHWRRCHPLLLVAERKWAFGNDPRKGKGGLCLLSPRGTVYELRGNLARRLQ